MYSDGVCDGVPTNYVIDRFGVVRYARAGAFNLAQLNALLVPLLNEPSPADATSQALASPPIALASKLLPR